MSLRSARVDELLGNAGKQILEGFAAAGQQAMGVAALGHAAARFDGGRESVAIDQGDVAVVAGEYAGGQQSAHASPDYDGVALLSLDIHCRCPSHTLIYGGGRLIGFMTACAKATQRPDWRAKTGDGIGGGAAGRSDAGEPGRRVRGGRIHGRAAV